MNQFTNVNYAKCWPQKQAKQNVLEWAREEIPQEIYLEQLMQL